MSYHDGSTAAVNHRDRNVRCIDA